MSDSADNSALRSSKSLAIVLVCAFILAQTGVCSPAKSTKASPKNDQNKAKPMPPAYSAAVQVFNAGKYKVALEQFQQLDATGYCCDKVHYFIAQSYQGMNQTEPAAMHYQWVCTYSKDPLLTYYSEVALSRLSYYKGHRTYKGNGNVFASASAPMSGG